MNAANEAAVEALPAAALAASRTSRRRSNACSTTSSRRAGTTSRTCWRSTVRRAYASRVGRAHALRIEDEPHVQPLPAFLVTLGILIVIHELGHYWVARCCGVKVLRFSIGFGRPIARWVRGPDRTEWVVSALPSRRLCPHARRARSEMHPEWPMRTVRVPSTGQPVGKRFAIVLAGPVANLLLAVFVYWLLNVIGVFEPRATLAAHRRGVRRRPCRSRGRRHGHRGGWRRRAFVERTALAACCSRRSPVRRSTVEVEGADGQRRTLTLEPATLGAADLESDVVAVWASFPTAVRRE